MNEYKLYELHELRKDQSDSTSDTFHMEPGRTLFITMRACNDAELCNNKSLGSVTMMDGKAVMETSVGGEAIEMEYDMSGRRKKRSTGDSLVIITPNGMLSNLFYSMGVRVLFQRCLNLVSTQNKITISTLKNVEMTSWYFIISPEGKGVYCFTLSIRPSKIFFSATIDGKNLIFGHKLHLGMPYCG